MESKDNKYEILKSSIDPKKMQEEYDKEMAKYTSEYTQKSMKFQEKQCREQADKCQKAIDIAFKNLEKTHDVAERQELRNDINRYRKIKDDMYEQIVKFSKERSADEHKQIGKNAIDLKNKFKDTVLNITHAGLSMLTKTMEKANDKFNEIGINAYNGIAEKGEEIHRAVLTQQIKSQEMYYEKSKELLDKYINFVQGKATMKTGLSTILGKHKEVEISEKEQARINQKQAELDQIKEGIDKLYQEGSESLDKTYAYTGQHIDYSFGERSQPTEYAMEYGKYQVQGIADIYKNITDPANYEHNEYNPMFIQAQVPCVVNIDHVPYQAVVGKAIQLEDTEQPIEDAIQQGEQDITITINGPAEAYNISATTDGKTCTIDDVEITPIAWGEIDNTMQENDKEQDHDNLFDDHADPILGDTDERDFGEGYDLDKDSFDVDKAYPDDKNLFENQENDFER